MSNFNKVILMGNLTRDPELRYTTSGTPVTHAGLAVHRLRKDREGNRSEETSFFDLRCFGNQAETLARYLEKGSPLLVDGHLRSWSHENEEGQKKKGVDVIVERFHFLPRREKEREEGGLDG